MKHTYEVYCGNVGCIHTGHSSREALKAFREYVGQSKSDCGRAGGEDVAVFKDGEILREYYGTLQQSKYLSE
jgi:hypothetical protein